MEGLRTRLCNLAASHDGIGLGQSVLTVRLIVESAGVLVRITVGRAKHVVAAALEARQTDLLGAERNANGTVSATRSNQGNAVVQPIK